MSVNNLNTFVSKKPASNSQDFSFLRESALKLIQEFGQDHWSDHNIHDPGITLLEALAYVLTELGLKVNLPVPDIILSRNEFESKLALFPFCERDIFFNLPVSSEDYEKVLADIFGLKKGRLLNHDLIDPAIYSFLTTSLSFDPIDPVTESQGKRLTVKGEYNAIISFLNDRLNDNIVSEEITIGVNDYIVEIALPYWDITPHTWRRSISLATITLPGGIEYVEAEQVYLSGVNVEYNGGEVYNFGIVSRISAKGEYDLPDSTLVINALASGSNPGTELQNAITDFNQDTIISSEISLVVEKKMNSFRNLSEMLNQVQSERIMEIAFNIDLVINVGVDVDNLLSEIFFVLDTHFSNSPDYKSFNELDKEELELAEILIGPKTERGFIEIDDFDSNNRFSVIYVSKLIEAVLNIKNRSDFSQSIIAIRSFTIDGYINNYKIESNVVNCLQLPSSGNYQPKLSTIKSNIRFYQDNSLITTDYNTVTTLLDQKKALEKFPGTSVPSLSLFSDFDIKEDLGKYYPVQNELPVNYGIKSGELPENSSEEQKAQAKQLRGYLLFFEQLLANNTIQISELSKWFSSDTKLKPLDLIYPLYDIPDVHQILKSYLDTGGSWQAFMDDKGNPYVSTLLTLNHSIEKFTNEKNNALNHLIARLGEDLSAYDEVMYSIYLAGITDPLLIESTKADIEEKLIAHKSELLNDYITISAERGKGYAIPGRPKKINVFEEPVSNFNWELLDDNDQILFRSSNFLVSKEEAYLQASQANRLATNDDFYQIANLSPFTISLTDIEGITIADHPSNFVSISNANAKKDILIASFQDIWNTDNVSGLQKRVSRLLGFENYDRRNLVHPEPFHHFLIEEDPAEPNSFSFTLKRTIEGSQMRSGYVYPTRNDAENGIQSVIRSAIDTSNFQDQIVGSNLIITLSDIITFTDIASISINLDFEPDPELIIQELVDFFKTTYGPQEGFYLLEHMLLLPIQIGAPPTPFLTQVLDEQEVSTIDPYSYRITVILPEDYLSTGLLAPPNSTLESRFGMDDFRRFVEKTIKEECPAHIIVNIFWLDETNLQDFQNIYRTWLTRNATYLVDQTLLNQALIDLISSINQEIDRS